jgi:hypothetical protein
MTLESRRNRAEQFADFVEDAKRQPGIYSLSMRYAQVLCLLETAWASRRKLQEQNAQLRRGGRTLGSIVDRQCQYALDATGLHHLIDETGDGDWGAVWENLAELGVMAKAARRYAEDAKSTYRSLESSRARVAELEAFVADIACHGLRGDMNPTMIAGSAWERELHLLQYLRSLNDHLKAAAREYVPTADVPNDRGRPRPAPRVEVVAESVTELDLLRAQDGDR